ncbi:MAG: hypothetical protein MUO73_03170 [Thermoplasmata archaeon]|nr:hypothetical protein [Thermoplasmata archaeon]
MRRSIVIIGIIICAVGTFMGIICSFLFADTMKQYVESNLVDLFGLISALGFFSFFIGILLSIIGAVLKKKKPKKTKSLPFSRYYNY